jgi:5-methylcytosine-specific restriction protein B
MTFEQAANHLKQMYNDAAKGEQALSVHLFGIKYAKDIDGMSTHEIAERAGLPRSYGTEIRKGVNLARYVELK